jgi:hypothetical protein
MDAGLRTLCDISMDTAREYAGRHEYDGETLGLGSPPLGRLDHALAPGSGPTPPADPADAIES